MKPTIKPLIVSLLLFGGTSWAQDIRVREDIETVAKDPAKVQALELAFDTLEKSTDATKNFKHWYNIHGAPGADAPAHPCVHGNEQIWAWHRAYLWEFETALRESHPPETSNVTLPYWDWSVTSSGRRLPAAYERTGSSLIHSDRNPAGFTGARILPQKVADILGIPTWAQFGSTPASDGGGKGALESQLHDIIHGFVGNPALPNGRSMGDARYSARDPIFYAHHANLDRLWAQWQERWGQAPKDLDASILGVPGNYKQRDWVDISTRYRYADPAPPQPPVPVPGHLLALHNPALVAARTDKLAVFAMAERLPKKFTPGEQVVLELKDLQLPKDAPAFINARVFLLSKGKALKDLDEATRQKAFLTSFTHWNLMAEGMAGEHAHGHGAVNFSLDVTSRAVRMASTGDDAAENLVIEFSTAPDSEGKDAALPGGTDGVHFLSAQLLRRTLQVQIKPLQAIPSKLEK